MESTAERLQSLLNIEAAKKYDAELVAKQKNERAKALFAPVAIALNELKSAGLESRWNVHSKFSPTVIHIGERSGSVALDSSTVRLEVSVTGDNLLSVYMAYSGQIQTVGAYSVAQDAIDAILERLAPHVRFPVKA